LEGSRLKPDRGQAWNRIGLALRHAGRFAEAREAFLKAHALDPKATGILLNLANTTQFSAGDPVIASMEALLRDEAELPETARAPLAFALGKAYADIGEPARSFAHLARGNALKRRQTAYDEAGMLRQFDMIAAAFTGELLRAKAGSGAPSRLPIFILGMPRSGTTLVEQIVASHQAVHGGGELRYLPETVAALSPRYPADAIMLGSAQLRALGERYLARLGPLAPEAAGITDKMPSNFFFLGLIHLALPDAVVIHVMRDPVDTCYSCFATLFSDRQDFSFDLGELGRYYRRYQGLMAHWRRVLPPGRMLEVAYEDVVADTERAARAIIAHCGLDWDPACLSFHETERSITTASGLQVRQPIYRTALGRARAYDEFLAPLRAALTA
jgi:tetratricopeptide (TPR) repeat protein